MTWEEFKNQEPEQQKEFIKSRLEAGTSKTALGEELGTSRNSINRLMQKLGMEEVKPVRNVSKKPQKAVTEDSITDRVNILEKQMEGVLKAIRMDSEYNMNTNDFKPYSFNSEVKQTTIRIHSEVIEKLNRFYSEYNQYGKQLVFNSLLNEVLDKYLKQ